MESGSKETNTPTKGGFQNLYSEFMAIFEIESREDLIQYLTDVNVPNTRVCGKVLKRGKNNF